MLVFMLLQVHAVFEFYRPKFQTPQQFSEFKLKMCGYFVVGLAITIAMLPTGYFGPLSSRIRGLFVKHTKTGNPLVDSVAEHQATADAMYHAYFHALCWAAPLAIPSLFYKPSGAKFFMLVFSLTAMYFSSKMVRLVLILSPAASVLGGITVAGTCYFFPDPALQSHRVIIFCLHPDRLYGLVHPANMGLCCVRRSSGR